MHTFEISHDVIAVFTFHALEQHKNIIMLLQVCLFYREICNFQNVIFIKFGKREKKFSGQGLKKGVWRGIIIKRKNPPFMGKYIIEKRIIVNYENMNMVDVELSHPWLSIVIPVYNAEKFLRKCLNSILEQTYTDFEVLLIDDGSTDTSFDICQNYSFSDGRLRYFRKENGGAYQSRIYGAERALGTYIMFCDADDFYANKDVLCCLRSYPCALYGSKNLLTLTHLQKSLKIPYRRIDCLLKM